jgi:hypothetical protein
MLMIRAHLNFVKEAINTLDSKLDALVAPYEPYIALGTVKK